VSKKKNTAENWISKELDGKDTKENTKQDTNKNTKTNTKKNTTKKVDNKSENGNNNTQHNTTHNTQHNTIDNTLKTLKNKSNKKSRYNVYLEENLVTDLDFIADKFNVSRSKLLNMSAKYFIQYLKDNDHL